MSWTLPIWTTIIASYYHNISPSCPIEALIYLPARMLSIFETSCFRLLQVISDSTPTIDHSMTTYVDGNRNIQNSWTHRQSISRMCRISREFHSQEDDATQNDLQVFISVNGCSKISEPFAYMHRNDGLQENQRFTAVNTTGTIS